MKKRQLLQKAGAWILSAALTVSCLSGIPAGQANAAAPENWKDEIYIDFGTGTNMVSPAEGNTIVTNEDGKVDGDLAIDEPDKNDPSIIKKPYKFAELNYTCNEPLIAGYGTWLYSDTTKDVGTVYGGASNGQKIGFDKAVPAGVTNQGGAYFRDWVFSPDGDPYTFSVDLPAGQYRVYVYTGVKESPAKNTTFVSFGDDNHGGIYDQSSNAGGQWPAGDSVYVVTVKDKANGCGTLEMKVFDNTIKKNADGSYEGDYTEENTSIYGKDSKVKEFVDNGNPNATEGKIVTARLNGIEIQPVETPVYAEEVVSEGNKTDIKVGVGQSMTLDAVAKGADDAEVTERLIYTSSNPENVTVNPKTGEIRGVTLGTTATITATTPSLVGNEEKSLKYNVSVIKQVDSVKFVDDDGNTVRSYTAFVGDSITAKAAVAPADATDKTVTYDFKVATDIAEINAETGVITARKPGVATVRATAVSSGSTKNATLTILPKFDISYKAAQVSLNVGAEQKNELSVALADEDPNNVLDGKVSYTYDSSDKTVATVDEDGKVKGLKAGKSTITVTAAIEGIAATKTASYEVNVAEATQHATDLNVEKTSISVAVKKTAQIKASLTPANSVDTITYTPANTKLISVDANGKITGKKPGKTQVTVKSSNGLTKVVNVTVTSPATKVKITVKGKSKARLTLKKGKKVTLKAKVTPSNSTDKVKWKSSKTKIATVSKKGLVKAKKKGKTVITATAGKKKAKITITVK